MKKKKENVVTLIEKAIVKSARYTAGIQANTTCPLWSYQGKEPEQLKKLRKF